MNNKEFAQALELRTKQFAVKILKLSAKLPNTAEANVIRNQISKSGTSVGANYREAIEVEVKRTLHPEYGFAKARLAKHHTGLRLSKNSIG
jgi:four helix bundle protein